METIAKCMLVLALAFAVVVICSIGRAIYADSHIEKIELIKSDWQCTAAVQRMAPQFAGKTPIMMPVTVCTQWQHN